MEESIAASEVILEVLEDYQRQIMEKVDEPEINSQQREESISKGKTEEIIMACSSHSCCWKNNLRTLLSNFHFKEMPNIGYDHTYTRIKKVMFKEMPNNKIKLYLELWFGDITEEREEELKQLLADLLRTLFDEGTFKIKKESHSLSIVIKIDGENQFTTRMKHRPKQHDHTIWATCCTTLIAITCSLGNPFDMLSKLEGIGKVKEQQSLLSFEEAFAALLPSMTLSAMFFLNFGYTTILTPLPFRVPAYLILLLLLFYYIMVLAEAMSGSAVLLGSIQMSALSFVSGGAIGLMMLMGFIITTVKFYFKQSFSLN